MKTCSSCKSDKQRGDFYKNKSLSDGLDSYCKECRKRSSIQYSHSEKGKASTRRWWQGENGQKQIKKENKRVQGTDQKKAQNAVTNAVRKGQIRPARELPCKECGQPATQYHHHNGYSKIHYLDVIPLCLLCHRIADGHPIVPLNGVYP